MPDHPIFLDIRYGDLEAVKQCVLADATVLDETEDGVLGRTPLIYAVFHEKPAIAHWLIEHRGQHNLDVADFHGDTALNLASVSGPLSLVQALVREGATPSRLAWSRRTQLMMATSNFDTVAYLLQQPCVRASIDHVDNAGWSAIGRASSSGSGPPCT